MYVDVEARAEAEVVFMRLWFVWGMLSAVVVSSIASVPSGSVALQSDVSEIRTKRVDELSTDQDIRRLSQVQGRYRENLPLMQKKDTIQIRQSSPARKKIKAPYRKKVTPKKSAKITKKTQPMKITRLK